MLQEFLVQKCKIYYKVHQIYVKVLNNYYDIIDNEKGLGERKHVCCKTLMLVNDKVKSH